MGRLDPVERHTLLDQLDPVERSGIFDEGKLIAVDGGRTRLLEQLLDQLEPDERTNLLERSDPVVGWRAKRCDSPSIVQDDASDAAMAAELGRQEASDAMNAALRTARDEGLALKLQQGEDAMHVSSHTLGADVHGVMPLTQGVATLNEAACGVDRESASTKRTVAAALPDVFRRIPFAWGDASDED